MISERALTELCVVVANELDAHEPWHSVLHGLREARPRAVAAQIGPPSDWPEAVAAVCSPALAQALTTVGESLCWRQNPNYGDAEFLRRYRYCELLGPHGHALSAEHALGLLYLAPHTLYPPHAHPAEEAYHVLSDGSEWQHGEGSWQARSPGQRIHHASGVIHAMRSGRLPLLAVYLWRGDIAAAATLVACGKSAAIPSLMTHGKR